MSALLFISSDGAKAYRAARQMGAMATAEQIERFAARTAQSTNGAPSIMRVVAGVAEIGITGVLTEAPDFFAAYFGGGNTSYQDIRASLQMAASDPAVREVVLAIDSPGGTVQGLFETLDVLETFSKPLRAQASFACSAAYAIAAQCDSILANTKASSFGSIGVAVAMFVDDAVVDITNTESPDKRPDVTTPEGVATVQRELDAFFKLFAEAIARGRGVTFERVTQDFGRGATLLTADAKKAGMIDGLVSAASPVSAAAPTESLAELLVTRLPEEDAATYIRRCQALLARATQPDAPPKPRSTESLTQAVNRLSTELPPSFPAGVHSVAVGLAAAIEAAPVPVTEDLSETTLEDLTAAIKAHTATLPPKRPKPNRQTLGEAVERVSTLDWSDPE